MTSLLSDASVLGLQGFMRRQTLPDACVLQTRTPVSDGAGGATVTYPEGSAVPCRLEPLDTNPREDGIGGREAAIGRWRLVLDPADVGTLTTDDRVRLTSLRGVTVSRLFEVVAPLGPKSWGVVANYVLTEIT